MPRRGTSWTAPHPCLIVRQVPSGIRRLHKTEFAPATRDDSPPSPALSRGERVDRCRRFYQPERDG